MITKEMIQMLLRKSLTLAAGLLIGAWVGITYPELVSGLFANPITGLVAALISLILSYKSEAAKAELIKTNTILENKVNEINQGK